MRLGDLDALKDILIQRRSELTGVAGDLGGALSGVIKLIDNAPTAEICYPYETRPQGEWIVDKWGMYHCNYCMKEKQQLFHNFCSNCGAAMRGDNNAKTN